MKKGNFLTLLKATRVERAFYIVSMILIPAAFASKITTEILVLSLCCILLYSVSGIHNSKRDKDHPLPGYYKKFMIFLVISTILLSLTNWIIFITVIIELILGIIYNTISRKILFGDATVLGFSHAAIPILASSLLLKLNFLLSLKLAGVLYVFIWLLGNARNQKDAKGDKKRGYKTYATILKDSRSMTKSFIRLSFLVMLISFLIFDLSSQYIAILCLIYFIHLIIFILTDMKKDALAMQITRLTIILFSLAFIIGKTSNYFIISLNLMLSFLFLIFIMPDIKKLYYLE